MPLVSQLRTSLSRPISFKERQMDHSTSTRAIPFEKIVQRITDQTIQNKADHKREERR
jgi:hypothetical protein